MRRRSVRTEIVAGIATLMLALAVVGGYALERQARMAETLRLEDQAYLPLSLLLGEVLNTQTNMDIALERVVERRDAVDATFIAVARHTRRSFILHARALAAAGQYDARAREDVATLSRVTRTLTAVERVWRENETTFGSLRDALDRGDSPEARAAARAIERPLLAREETADESLRQLAHDVQTHVRSLASEAEAEQARTLRVLSIVTLIALLVAFVTLAAAYRSLRPLAALIERVRAVAGGDLSRRVVPARNDEIGELAREFDNMVQAVKARDTALRDKAEEILLAEQHLEKVVETLRAAVMVVSTEGRVQSANPAARTLAGPDAVLIGAEFATTPFGAVDDIARAVRETCAGKPPPATMLAVPMGERILDAAVAAFVAPAGRASGALVVIDDVTEREHARARLLQNERLAAIGRMAAHVTHEVRNPLSSMALNAEMLADEARAIGAPGREVERLVAAIQKEIDRLTSITEEYLGVVRLPRPRLEREDIVPLIEETLGTMAPELARSGIVWTVRALDGLPAAMVDELQIRQALLNLLRNAREALEAMPEGARAVTIRIRPERGGVEVSLSDSGRGIAPDVQAHLFELFYTTKERGSGLGLPLTREIVVAHGGEIRVGTAPADEGGGAQFVIWLPGAPSDASDTRDAA